jgi:TRAP-type C4-dicarboxylate transport system permease small subunit
MNGLAGTLAAGINIWAIQGGHFYFNTPAIITMSITAGSTVICFALMVVYQFLLLSVKNQHRREMADEENGEAPGLLGTVKEYDTADMKESIFSSLTS